MKPLQRKKETLSYPVWHLSHNSNLSIQETVKDINKNIYESRIKSDLVVSKIEDLERTMNRFVYYNKEQNLLVVKTPDGDLVNIRTQRKTNETSIYIH